MARICIITPGQVGSNPRVVKEAATLAAAGHDVHVIATKVAAFVEPRDQEIMAGAAWGIERVAFDDRSKWRGERLRQIAARQAFQLTGSAKLAVHAHSAFTRRLIKAAIAVRADLYIAHYVGAIPAAALAARWHGGKFAFDAEDFHLGDHPDHPDFALDKALIKAIEGRFLPDAAYITAASPGIADAYAEAYRVARPTVVLNVFPKSQAPAAPTGRGVAQPGPSVYWFSQTLGPNRGLECAVRAIGMAKSAAHLYLRGTASGAFETRLRALAAEAGAGERLHLLPPAAPSQMEALAAAYDIGFVGETGETLNRQIALTNKQFTYLLAGIPAAMSDVPGHNDFAAQAQGAAFLYRTEDPEALAGVLDLMLSDPERLASARRRAFALGQQRFNWEAEQGKLLECTEMALRSRAAGPANAARPSAHLNAHAGQS